MGKSTHMRPHTHNKTVCKRRNTNGKPNYGKNNFVSSQRNENHNWEVS